MRKIIITLLTLLLLLNSNLFAQKKDATLAKLLEESGENTYLKDFPIKLKPGETERYTVVLSKNTIYEFYFYQEEQNQFMFLIDDRNNYSLDGGDIFGSPGVHEYEFVCTQTGAYRVKVQNISNNSVQSVFLLTFKERLENALQDSTLEKSESTADNNEQSLEKKSQDYYFVVDEMPKFNGKNKEGYDEFKDYLRSEIKYPTEAAEKKIEGRVFVSFVIGKDGYIKDANVVRSVHPSLDQEALRVVYSSPKWKPGIKDGKPVDVMFTFPIIFKISK